jgi:hypothetical protein
MGFEPDKINNCIYTSSCFGFFGEFKKKSKMPEKIELMVGKIQKTDFFEKYRNNLIVEKIQKPEKLSTFIFSHCIKELTLLEF